MKKLLCILAISLCTLSSFAQRDNQKWYNNGFGFRGEIASAEAYLAGIDYEGFFSPSFGINMMAITDFTVIYEGAILGKFVAPYPNVRSNLRWYCGLGVFGGYMSANKEIETSLEKYYFGPVASIGTGYAFTNIPIHIGIEWRPSLKAYYKNYVLEANRYRLNVKSVVITIRFITRNKYK